MHPTKLLLFFLLGFPAYGFSQKPIPVSISLFNESTAIPFTRYFATPVHPGIQIGTEFDYNQKTHSRLFQTANVSYFYHNYLAQGIGIHTELGYDYRLNMGLAFACRVGLGYMHTFATADEFRFEDGHYIRKSDKGNARLFPSFALDIGYYLSKDAAYSPKVFMRYQPWIEYPYSPDFIPVMTHINLHIGVTFFIHTKSSKGE